MKKSQEELIKKANDLLLGEYGWCVHCIEDNDYNIIEYHTHGLLLIFGHIDLQILSVPDLPISKAYDIINSIVSSIIDDEKFTNDDEFTIKNDDTLYKMKMVLENGFDRPLLRIIIPDENNLYPWDEGVNPYYELQFTGKDMKTNNYMVYGFYE